MLKFGSKRDTIIHGGVRAETVEKKFVKQTIITDILGLGWIFRGREPPREDKSVEALETVASPHDKKKDFKLLPYLMDRKPQVLSFVEQIEERAKVGLQHRPLVLVVHGNAQDRVLQLVTRFVRSTIPKRLSEEIARRTVVYGVLDWPDFTNDASDDNLSAQVNKFLANALTGRMSGMPDEVHQKLANAKQHHAIRCELNRQAWDRGGDRVVEKILDRIAAFPDVPESCLTCIFFCLVHDDRPPPGARAVSHARTAHREEENLKGLSAALDRLIRDYAQRKQGAFAYILLPQLDGIPQIDANEWLGRPEVEEACEDTDDLRDHIEGLYQNSTILMTRSDDLPGIRMADMATRLRRFLQSAT